MSPRRTVPLGLVLGRVRECEDGLRSAGWSSAADEVYALGLVLGSAGRRPSWLRLSWWLPVGSSCLFDGPGAVTYFRARRLGRALAGWWRP